MSEPKVKEGPLMIRGGSGHSPGLVESPEAMTEGAPHPPLPLENPPTAGLDRRSLLATSALLAGQVVAVVLSFTSVKLITTSVGATTYGIYATALAFTAIFSLLADFGVNAVVAREIARDPGSASRNVSLGVSLRVALSLVVAPLILIGSFAAYPDADPLLHLGIGLIAAAFLPDAVRSVLLGYFTATARNYWVAASTVIQQAAFVVGVLIATSLRLGLGGAFAAYLLATTTATCVVALRARRLVRIRPMVSLRAWRRLFVMSLSIGAIQIIDLLYLRVDGLLISVLLGTAATGPYAIAYMLISGVRVVPSFLMTSLLPKIVQSEPAARLAPLRAAMGILGFLASALIAFLTLASSAVVEVLSSSEFHSAAAPMLVLSIATFFGFINSVTGYASAALNVHHRIVWISLAALAVNVGLNLVLIPLAGITGAAVATLVCESLSFVAVYLTFWQKTGLRVPLVPVFLRGAALIALTAALGRLFEPALTGSSPGVVVLVALLAVALAGAAVLGSGWLVSRSRWRRRGRVLSRGVRS